MKTALSELTDDELSALLEYAGSADSLDSLATQFLVPQTGSTSPLSESELKDKARAEASYYEFFKQAFNVIEATKEYIDNWHIEALCDHFQALVSGEIKNLLVNVPPGTSKSFISSVYLAPWAWIHDPSHKFLYASYDQALSTRDSLLARVLINSEWYQTRWGGRFGFQRDQNGATKYSTTAGGWRLATSTGGRGTGEHPDTIVCDDPHRVRDHASGEVLQSVWDWWCGTISSRGKMHNSRKAVIMQRVAFADLSGRIMAQQGGSEIEMPSGTDWDAIVLPMWYEPNRMPTTSLGWNDPRTVEGELLCEQMYDEQKAESLRRDMLAVGPEHADGQLQQRPVKVGGRFFHREAFEIVDAVPAGGCLRCRYWDKAGTKGGGAYTVSVLMAYHMTSGKFYVEDVIRVQLGPAERNALIRQTAELDASKHGRSGVQIRIEQEPGSGGKESGIISLNELVGYLVSLDRVGASKESRAGPYAAQVGAGNVALLRGPWIEAFLQEHEQFPLGTYKDQVDAAGGAFAYLVLASLDENHDGLIISGSDPREHERLTIEEIDELPDELSSILKEIRGVKK